MTPSVIISCVTAFEGMKVSVMLEPDNVFNAHQKLSHLYTSVMDYNWHLNNTFASAVNEYNNNILEIKNMLNSVCIPNVT